MTELSVVRVWWCALSLVALLNVALWSWSTRAFLRARTRRDDTLAVRWPQVALSGVYVVGCAFRSFLPRADVQRIVVYDSWLSSVLVGRSVATVAELCFVAQWALVLRELSRAHQHPFGERVARSILPLIVTAELFSWYAVLSTSYLGNTIEQSLWTVTVALLAIALLPIWREARGDLRRFVGTSIALSVGFVLFMSTVDVPMYLSRWLEDEAEGRSYLSLSQGLNDVATRWVVTHQLADWREELAWMALYFSVAVWFSIALVHAPRAPSRRRGDRARPGLARAREGSLQTAPLAVLRRRS